MQVYDCFVDKITTVFMVTVATEIPTVTVVALIANVTNIPVSLSWLPMLLLLLWPRGLTWA
jgi:hypothetical protein